MIKPGVIKATLVILIVAGALRFVNLNSLPIFADESIYVRWSQVMRAESTLRFLPLSDGKQPLFMWVTIPFLKVISDPLVASRALSALTGIALVIGVGVFTQLLFDNWRQSLVAAAVSATLPYLVFFSRMALADSMLAMFMVWTAIFSLISLKYDRWDWSMVAGFTFGFAWLSKSPAIFCLGLLPLGLLFSKLNFKKILYLVTTFAIGFGMYNILRLGPEFHMIALRNKDYVFPLSEIIIHPLDPFIPHLKDSVMFYFYLATPVGLILAVWGLISGKLLLWRQKLILAAWVLGPILAQSLIAKQFTARYLLFTVPFAAILMSQAIERIGQRTQKHFLSWGAALLLIVCSLYMDYLLIFSPQTAPLPRVERAGYLEQWTAGFGVKDVADQIKLLAKNGPVLVGSEGYFGTPFSALQMYLNGETNVRIIGVGVWIDSVDEKLTNSLKDNQVFLVVNSSRLHADPDKLGLKLIASYPKATPPSGVRESLLFFQVLPQ